MRHSTGSVPAIAAALIWAVVVGGGLVAGLRFYPAWLLGGTVATLALYGYDKVQARRGGWRTWPAASRGSCTPRHPARWRGGLRRRIDALSGEPQATAGEAGAACFRGPC